MKKHRREILTSGEFCAKYGISYRTFLRYIANGKLPRRKLGKKYHFIFGEVDKCLRTPTLPRNKYLLNRGGYRIASGVPESHNSPTPSTEVNR